MFIMEYISGGDLFFHIRKAGSFTPNRARFCAAEILLAMEHIHAMGIIYRDLKPENVLIDSEGHIKIIDFGLSNFRELRKSVTESKNSRTSIFSNNVLTHSENSNRNSIRSSLSPSR